MEMIPALPSGSLKALMFPPLLNKLQNNGTRGVRAGYDAELPPFISIVRYPGRPVILGMDFGERTFTFGERTGFSGFLEFLFLLLGGFGTPRVGGPSRGFRKYLTFSKLATQPN